MQFYQGHQTIYTYSATGEKLKVIDKTAPGGAELPITSLNTVLTNPSVAMTTTTDYVGNMIYENGVLKRILTPTGYWQSGTYYYFLKDHLGSNRVVINGSGGVVESSSYYPSGMRFGESAVILNNSIQPYRHTGLEMQKMHGLNWIDNLARFRTVSDGGGFTGVDPLAEKDYSVSPYAYCAGNPINMTDPTGMLSEDPHEINWLESSKILNLDPNANLRDRVIDYDSKFPFISPTNKSMYITEAAGNDKGGDSKNALQGSEGNAIVGSKDNPIKLREPSVTAKMPRKFKYGKIIGYVSLSFSATIGGGLAGEFGYVYTDKNYVQYYISYGTTLGIGTNANANTGLIFALPGKNPQLDDWEGTFVNGNISISPLISGQINATQNYVAVAASLGVGARWNMRANGGQGKTILLGSPINKTPESGFFTKNYNPF